VSKSMAPGLRTAWLLTPPGTLDRATAAIRATVWSVPPLGPAVASQWVADGTAAELERVRRVELDHRLAMVETLLGAGVQLAQRSMHVWLPLPKRLRAQVLTERAAEAGVRVAPGTAFSLGMAPNAIRLSIGAAGSGSHGGRAACACSVVRGGGTDLIICPLRPISRPVSLLTMVINGAWNNRCGPGGSARRLHQILA
jgi:hypothetical protein